MKYIITLNGKNYEVEVEKSEAKLVNVTDVAIAPVAAPTSVPVVEVASGNGNALAAPMPGNVIDLKKNVGDKVLKGDVVLVLEAMKMENDIPAHIDGTITQIVATKGATVSTGDTLFVIG